MSRNRGFERGAECIVGFEDRTDGTGFTIVDYVERRRCEVCTPAGISPRKVSDENFHLPIDFAVTMTTGWVSIPHTVTACVRDRLGTLIEEATKSTERRFPNGYYRIELTSPIKLYLLVEAGFEITVTTDEVRIEFDREAEVQLGARSNHDHPAATITTTDDPEDLMQALSVFGSALKTTTCERSYPTLRGHPPRIARGEQLAIPDILDAPDTGITIEVVPAHEAVWVVGSLAYYLGADVVPGSEPKIVTEDGFVHRLTGARGFEGEVERVLKQCFFLDCLTRIEGHYPVKLHERNEIEEEVAIDFSEQYGRPLTEQVETYLDVSYEVVEPHVPRWKLTAHVEPTPAHVETLPFLVQDLAAIRSRDPPSFRVETSSHTAESLGIKEFIRGHRSDRPVAEAATGDEERHVIRIEESNALEDVWIGDGIPIGASKGMIEGFRNRLERTPSDGNIDITVVINDPEMVEEGRDVNEVYGSRENLPLNVRTRQNLTKENLETVLSSETDFLHYIGHAEESGFQCVDGELDGGRISETGIDAFFLNACDSYQPGKQLIEAGAIAGLVTLAPVPNKEAQTMGKKLARLLNWGFPFYIAVDIANLNNVQRDYITIGKSDINIAQTDSNIASLLNVEEKDEYFHSTYETYPTINSPLGSMSTPFVNDSDKYYLTSGETGVFKLTEDELSEFISLGEFPIVEDSNIHWGNTNNVKQILGK